MRRVILYWLGLLLLAIPRPMDAQTGDPADPFSPGANSPVQMLLDHRDEMGLTARQVARLEVIQGRVEERNRPLVQRFLEMRRRWERQRPADWQTLTPARRRQIQERFQSGIREESRALREQVQANHRAAMLEVRALLTIAQRQRLRTLLQSRPGGATSSTGPVEQPDLAIALP